MTFFSLGGFGTVGIHIAGIAIDSGYQTALFGTKRGVHEHSQSVFNAALCRLS